MVVVLEVNINLITEVWIRVKFETNHKGHCNCRVQLICSKCTQASDCNVIVADSYFIILGYTFGATIVERHITLDRTMWGTDHMSSVEPQGLIKLVKGVRELEKALGDGEKQVWESEKPFRAKLRGY